MEELIAKRLEISGDSVKFVIGKQGTTLKTLQQKYDCRIVITDEINPQGNQTCHISGTITNVRLAQCAIEKLCEKKITQSVLIPLDKCGIIIGKSGQTIEKLRRELEVEMRFPSGNGQIINNSKPLTIIGSAKNVDDAVRIVKEMIENGRSVATLLPIALNQINVTMVPMIPINQTCITVESRQPPVPLIVRDKNPVKATNKQKTSFINFSPPKLNEIQRSLRKIRSESKATVILPQPRKKKKKKPSQWTLIIKGNAAQINEAKRLFRQILDSPKPAPTNANNFGQSTLKQSTNVHQQPRKQFECDACFDQFYVDEMKHVKCFIPHPSSATTTIPKESHSICISCIQGYAHAACTDIPVAFGGIGLNCVSSDCGNVFMLSTFEKFLNAEDCKALKERLQQQCIADAGIEDLVTCQNCGTKVCVPSHALFYLCSCGRRQCRTCPRPYDAQHFSRTCEAMDEEDEKKDSSSKKLESKISEAIIRKCFKCGINFMKNEGCNKMECRCGAKQCYVCREKNIDYGHFCQCGDLTQKHGKCRRCNKNCRLWEDAEELDQLKINELTQQIPPVAAAPPIASEVLRQLAMARAQEEARRLLLTRELLARDQRPAAPAPVVAAPPRQKAGCTIC